MKLIYSPASPFVRKVALYAQLGNLTDKITFLPVATTALNVADDALEPLLARLSEHFESKLHPKPIWKMEKMTDGVKMKMMRQILPFKFEISELHSTWKLGQNKPEHERLDAADALTDHVPTLAKLMKDLPQ